MAAPTFSKLNNFSQIKKRVLPIEWGHTWKMMVHNYLIHRGHQLPESNRRMASHTYVIDQWIWVMHSGSQLTTHGTRWKRALHVVPLPSIIESPLPPTHTFDTSLPVLPIPLPPSLSNAPELVVPISTPVVPVSDLSRPSQPQVVDANPSTLSITAHLDTL